MFFLKNHFFSSLLILIFFFLIMVVKFSCTMLKITVVAGIPVFFLIPRELFCLVFAVNIWFTVFIILRKLPSIPSFQR